MEVDEVKNSPSNSLGCLKVPRKDLFHGKKLKQSTRELLEEVIDDFENLEKYASSNCESKSLGENPTSFSSTASNDIVSNKNLSGSLTSSYLSDIASAPRTEFCKPAKNVINDSPVRFVNKGSPRLDDDILKTDLPVRAYELESTRSVKKTNSNEELLADILKGFEDIDNCECISALKCDASEKSKDFLEETSQTNMTVLPKINLSKKANELEYVGDVTNKDSIPESRKKAHSKLLAEVLGDFENMDSSDTVSVSEKMTGMLNLNDQKLVNSLEKSKDCLSKTISSTLESMNVPVNQAFPLNHKKISLKDEVCMSNQKSGNSSDVADKNLELSNPKNITTLTNKDLTDILTLTEATKNLPKETCELVSEPVNKEYLDENIFVLENEFLTSKNLNSVSKNLLDMQVVSKCDIESEPLPAISNSLSHTVSEFINKNITQQNNISSSDTIINFQLIDIPIENESMENVSQPQRCSKFDNSFHSPENVVEVTVKSSLLPNTPEVYRKVKSTFQKLSSVNELISSCSDQDSEKQDSNDCEYFPSKVKKLAPSISSENKIRQKDASKCKNDKSPLAKPRRINSKMRAEWVKELKMVGHLRCPMIGCFQSYVSVDNFEAHYKWCTGNNELKQCPYCKSLIFAYFNASLHHIEVEHPEKVKEYKANCPDIEVIYVQDSEESKAKLHSKDMPKKSTKSTSSFNMKSLNKADIENLEEFKKCVNLNNISVFEFDSAAAETIQSFQNVSDTKLSKTRTSSIKKGKRKGSSILFSERHKRYIESLRLTRDWASERKSYNRPALACPQKSSNRLAVSEESVKYTYQTEESKNIGCSSLQNENSLVANILSKGFPDTITKLEKCIDRNAMSNLDPTQLAYTLDSNEEQSNNLNTPFCDSTSLEGKEITRSTSLIASTVRKLGKNSAMDLEASQVPTTFECLNKGSNIPSAVTSSAQNPKRGKFHKKLKSKIEKNSNSKNNYKNQKINLNNKKHLILFKGQSCSIKNTESVYEKPLKKSQNKFSLQKKPNLKIFGIKRNTKYMLKSSKIINSPSIKNISSYKKNLKKGNNTTLEDSQSEPHTSIQSFVQKIKRGRKRKTPEDLYSRKNENNKLKEINDENKKKIADSNDPGLSSGLNVTSTLRRSQRKSSRNAVESELVKPNLFVSKNELIYSYQLKNSSRTNLSEKATIVKERSPIDSETKSTTVKKFTDTCAVHAVSSSSGKKIRPTRASALKGKTIIQNALRKTSLDSSPENSLQFDDEDHCGSVDKKHLEKKKPKTVQNEKRVGVSNYSSIKSDN